MTNTLELAEITVSKKVEGPGPEGAEYSFELACIYHGTDGDVPFPLAGEDAKFTLKHGESRTIEVLAGVDCAVVETDLPAGASVAYLDNDDTTDGGATDGKIADLHGDGNKVEVTNFFEEEGDTPGIPVTGDASLTAGLVLAGLLLLAGAALMVARRRRRLGVESEVGDV